MDARRGSGGCSGTEQWSNSASVQQTLSGFIASKGVKRRRDDDGQGWERTIVHIDVDCFYAQCEELRDPTLRGKPVGVQQKFLVITSNYAARQHGLTKGMNVKEAKQKCPQLILKSGENLDFYRETSQRIFELLCSPNTWRPMLPSSRTPHPINVERLGLDEFFIDVTPLVTAYDDRIEQLERGGTPSGQEAAELPDSRLSSVCGSSSVSFEGHVYSHEGADPSIAVDCESAMGGCVRRLALGSIACGFTRRLLVDKMQLTTCGGVSYNKMLAKKVGGEHKPNQQTCLLPDRVKQFMQGCTLGSIPGIGFATCAKLKERGLASVPDVLSSPPHMIRDAVGHDMATVVLQLCNGIDPTPVKQTGPPQSISVENSYWASPIFGRDGVMREITRLAPHLIQRSWEHTARHRQVPQTFKLTVRFVGKSSRECRQAALPPNAIPRAPPASDRSSAVGEGEPQSPPVPGALIRLAASLLNKLVPDTSRPFHCNILNLALTNFHSAPPPPLTFSRPQPPQQSRAAAAQPPCPETIDLDTFDEEQKQPSCRVPDGVDAAWFMGLPAGIQAEVRRQHVNRGGGGHGARGGGRATSILDYVKRQKEP
ncbi:unnamed protein product [Vitrella brassicaformis CCMP3155]|uniref:UmuC domain-containing protein n=2 Tax=Vitrella brassicaformis TaxID=1169539 RepID=A0A0G4EKQ6_VITBC|nr:unnamed protein product [Vitrella brassicaformis CCMP3155]|eukprot:CEL97102.1 unnamed protein product [Vitrella brassicaformis CCMP3155]